MPKWCRPGNNMQDSAACTRVAPLLRPLGDPCHHHHHLRRLDLVLGGTPDGWMTFAAPLPPGAAVLHISLSPPPVAPLVADGGGLGAIDYITPAVGRYSSQELHCWRTRTTDPWVLSTLTEGYSIQFSRRPPCFQGVIDTTMGRPEKALILRGEIGTLLEKGAISAVNGSRQQGGFYSTYFLIPKKDGGLRPILDLRSLNRYLRVLRFKMLRTSDVLLHIREGDWFASIDLKDAYFHVPIAPHHRQFLRFAFEGQAYEFNVLPFGISLAPRVFTRCVAAALAPLQAQGLRILPYLDDWLICSQSEDQARADIATVLAHVADLGLKVNFRKSSLMPSQEAVFLGMHLDSRSLRATPSQTRIRSICQLLGHFRLGRSLTLKEFQRLLGMLAAASSLVPLGLLDLRPLQRWVIDLHLHPARHGHRLVRVTHACYRLLRPWRRAAYFLRGVPLAAVPSRREVVTTDASLGGWGAVWQCRTVRGCWDPQQQQWHINVLELQAVLLGLRHFLPHLSGLHVLVRTDNSTVVYYINHQGGTKSRRCLRVADQLLRWAHRHLLSLRAMYLPGVANTAADLLSRQGPDPGGWRLHPAVVLTIWERFGRAEVDLFACQESTHCPLWFSLRGPSPLGQDALAHAWPCQRLYAFPPLPLIVQTLHRVALEDHELLLVAPRWPGRVWFPTLLQLLDGEPWCLPVRADLLSQLGGQIWHPCPARLQLWVWPLKGRTPC